MMSNRTLWPSPGGFPFRRILVGLAYVCALLLAWKAYVYFADVPAFLLPAPEAVLSKLGEMLLSGATWGAVFHTVGNALLGLVLGSAIGFMLGYGIASSDRIRRILSPYVTALQASPKVALVPLFVLWFGLGPTTQLLLICLLVFFPTMTGTIVGFTTSKGPLDDLGRLLNMGWFQMFWHIRLPAALPSIFTYLKLAATEAFTGATLAEFVASASGLGYLVALGSVTYDPSLMIASIVLIVTTSLAIYACMSWISSKAIRWSN